MWYIGTNFSSSVHGIESPPVKGFYFLIESPPVKGFYFIFIDYHLLLNVFMLLLSIEDHS